MQRLLKALHQVGGIGLAGSLALLVSGLLAIAANRTCHDAGWAWIKALLSAGDLRPNEECPRRPGAARSIRATGRPAPPHRLRMWIATAASSTPCIPPPFSWMA